MGISDNISKRKLLSIVNSIYDPISFTSPATLLPKLLLQEAWRNKLDWDEEFTLDMQLRYRRWAKHIALIEKCRIPRRILYGNFKKLLYIYLLMLRLMGMPAVLFYDVKMKERLILGKIRKILCDLPFYPDHPIVRRLINYVHQKLQHAGVQTTLFHLRECFWIPRGWKIVREVLQKCVTWKRYTLRPMVPDGPAPLPANRINRVAAFEVTGTDLAGRACVSYEEMVTELSNVKASLMDVHLPIYDDSNELRAIKPSDFIQDIKGSETMDLDIVD
ncbi:reverse transcriptase [Caerostris extrusa]|uniref:Reverse transcriptase n=1 Tax=Caerostris extrusa TaxID=172846 RepID=A0AAV4X5W4_CAEEX|nr:reverse transcriptase [Caerostris extrusa]